MDPITQPITPFFLQHVADLVDGKISVKCDPKLKLSIFKPKHPALAGLELLDYLFVIWMIQIDDSCVYSKGWVIKVRPHLSFPLPIEEA